MEITDVRVYVRNESKLKAFATITLGGVLVVHNMKIIQGQKGLILCMPSRKGPDGAFRDVVHPITNEFRHELERRVFAAYEEEVKKKPDTASTVAPSGESLTAEQSAPPAVS